MKKSEALKIFNAKVDGTFLHAKSDVEKVIRAIADGDEGFENTVFELGCSVLAKECMKHRTGGTADD